MKHVEWCLGTLGSKMLSPAKDGVRSARHLIALSSPNAKTQCSVPPGHDHQTAKATMCELRLLLLSRDVVLADAQRMLGTWLELSQGYVRRN